MPRSNSDFLLLNVLLRRSTACLPAPSPPPAPDGTETRIENKNAAPSPNAFPSWGSCVAQQLCHYPGKSAEFVSFVSLEIKSYSL